MRRRDRQGETYETAREPRSHAVSRLIPDARIETALRAATRRGGRLLAWAVVLASPLVTLAVLVLLRPTTHSESPDGTARLEQPDPRGWAEMYVRAWLSASRDDSAGLETFYPPGMKTQRMPGTQVPVDTSTIAVTSPSAGVWSVVVAVNLLTQPPEGKHIARLACVQVSMLGQLVSGAATYVAAALPSPVTCPATMAAVELNYPETAEITGPIGQSVLGFLAAYLAGQGGLDRYITPGASLAPVVPAAYATVQLSVLKTHEAFEPGQAARPPDGTEIHVLARASGYDATGQVTVLDYALTLAARAGRWEVRRIDPAPQLASISTKTTPTPPSSSRSTAGG
ncbi:hypothetical protein [Amycolatopsis sp. NPDC059657]|uniref:hypothetical protein n=1 Tax=Amycolatopsis sp. NPDC059657 TaxID=3346899 RepID=UPI00367091A5